MKQYPIQAFPHGPPINDLLQLAIDIIQSATNHNMISTRHKNLYIRRLSIQHSKLRPEEETPVEDNHMVTWEGVETEWFLDVFLNMVEIKALIEYECPM